MGWESSEITLALSHAFRKGEEKSAKKWMHWCLACNCMNPSIPPHTFDSHSIKKPSIKSKFLHRRRCGNYSSPTFENLRISVVFIHSLIAFCWTDALTQIKPHTVISSNWANSLLHINRRNIILPNP